jgi:hypothetical protein
MANKNLRDYISFGNHEFIAFVKNKSSLVNKEGHNTLGNDLGKTYLGILVCNKDSRNELFQQGNKVDFFYKEKSVYDGDSDIVFGDFDFKDAEIVNEVPLGIFTYFYNRYHLKKRTKEFYEAKKLLTKYGIY